MHTILTVTQVVLSIALIVLVLIQHGRGADAGAAFGSGASATVFGARGSGSFLSRATGIIAALFFLTSMAMAYYASQGGKPKGLMDGATGLPVKVETPAGVQVPAIPGGFQSGVPMVPGLAPQASGSDVPAVPGVVDVSAGAPISVAPVDIPVGIRASADGPAIDVPVVPVPNAAPKDEAPQFDAKAPESVAVPVAAPVKEEAKDKPEEKVQPAIPEPAKAQTPATPGAADAAIPAPEK